MLEADELLLNHVLDVSIGKNGFEATMEQLLFPFLENIGTLWLAGTIFPAQEHFISNLIRQRLMVAIDQERIKTEVKLPRILFYLPEGEFHDIGILYYCYLARKANFEVIYLGTSVPFRDIVRMDDICPFQIIFTSFVTSQGKGTLAEIIEKKRKTFPDKIFLISGWQIKQEQPYLPKNFFKVSSSADLKKALDYFLKKNSRNQDTD